MRRAGSGVGPRGESEMGRRQDLLTGAAIGIGLTVLVPVVVAAALPVVRPLARSAMKAGIRVYERGREALEEFNEAVDDVRAEVEQEMHDAMLRRMGDEEVLEEEPVEREVETG